MNPKKSIIKNKYDKAALNNAQKTAIFLRRIEYSTNMRKNNKNKKPNQEIIAKIIIIQKWWKTLYLIILLQKNIRGFLSRTKLIESLEKQENFINMLLHIHWLHKKIVFTRFVRKLSFNDRITLLLKMINHFFIANLRLLIRKWNFISLKIKKNRNLKSWFEDWKKIVQKFSIVKSMLHNYSKNKNTKSNKDNNMNKNIKKINSKNRKEEKNEKEEEIKIKKTIVCSFNKKNNKINERKNDNLEELEFLNDNNNMKENSEIMLFKNKRNSVKNLKKFEDITKTEMNKTKILSSRGNEFSNRNDMNKTFTNEKIDKFSKTEFKMITTKKRINEKIEEKEKDKNKDIDIEKDKNKKNKTKYNKNKLMKRNITSNNNSKILNIYNSNTNKDLNIYNSSKVLNNNQISNTPKKEIKSKEIINNKNFIDIRSNVKNKKNKKEKEKDKEKDKENDNSNVNFIIDPPFQDILKENTQAAIKEKEQILNTDNYDIKEEDMYNKQFDKENLITFNSIDDENIKDISFKNEDNLFSNNNEMNNDNQKKIKEMVITFEKKPTNNYNVSKTEENTIKNMNIENVNNNNKILDNDKNMPNKKEENNKIIENNSKEEYNNLEKPKDRKISDKMGSPTLIKKNNIFQAKIQFQKPTQNILELKQKNNELNQLEKNENSNNNNTEIDDDIDNININQELENLSKFKPPSKIKEIVIENLNLNKHDQRNDDFYTGYNNHITVEDDRRLNHSLSNYELGQDFYMNNLNLSQNIYNPINERFIKFSYNPNNEVLGYTMPVDQINNFEFRRNNSNNIPNFGQSNEFENNNINVNTFHKKTFSSNNLYQYKHPHLSGMTFTKKIIPNSDVSFSYSNNNFNLRDSQNFNSNNQLNLTLNNGISNSCIPNNFGNKIYMRRVNICPPKNLNKTYIQQQGINNSKIN